MSIKKNYVYNLVYQVFIMILPIITIPYVSRVLGPSGLGTYSFISSIASYYVLVGGLGISAYGRREVAYIRDNKYLLSKTFYQLYKLQIITMGIAIISYNIMVFLFIRKQEFWLYFVHSITLIAALLDISWFYIGIENFKNIVRRNIIIKILTLIFIFIFVKNKQDILIYTILLSSGTLIGQLVLWADIKKHIYKKSLIDKKDLMLSWDHLKGSLVLFISVLAINIYLAVDKTLIGLISGTDEVGVYDSAQRIIRITLTIITSFVAVMAPRISNIYVKGNNEEINVYLEKSLNFVSLISIGMIFGLMGISKNFIPWFLGEGFERVSILLCISSPMIIFIAIREVIGNQLLIPTGKVGEYNKSILIGLGINIVLNIILINFINSIGAIIATLFSEIVIVVIQMTRCIDIIDMDKLMRYIVKYICSGIIMLVLVLLIGHYLKPTILVTFIQIIVGLVVYTFILIVLKDEIILSILKKFNSHLKRKLAYYDCQ